MARPSFAGAVLPRAGAPGAAKLAPLAQTLTVFAAAAADIARQRETGSYRLREVVIRRRGLRTDWHQHARPYFALTLDGAFTQAFGRATVACRPGTLLYHPLGEHHADHFLTPEVRILQIELECPRASGAPDGTLPPGGADLASPRMRRVAYDLYTELRRPDAHSALAIEGLVLQLLAVGCRAEADERRAGPPPVWLTRAAALLRERFAERLSLGGVARSVGVHPTHLARQFSRYERCSVGQRLRQLRVAYAGRALAGSEASLAEIALAAGFADQSHFARVFRAHMGIPPGEYRRAHRR